MPYGRGWVQVGGICGAATTSHETLKTRSGRLRPANLCHELTAGSELGKEHGSLFRDLAGLRETSIDSQSQSQLDALNRRVEYLCDVLSVVARD